jgi:hypothetical protein
MAMKWNFNYFACWWWFTPCQTPYQVACRVLCRRRCTIKDSHQVTPSTINYNDFIICRRIKYIFWDAIDFCISLPCLTSRWSISVSAHHRLSFLAGARNHGDGVQQCFTRHPFLFPSLSYSFHISPTHSLHIFSLKPSAGNRVTQFFRPLWGGSGMDKERGGNGVTLFFHTERNQQQKPRVFRNSLSPWLKNSCVGEGNKKMSQGLWIGKSQRIFFVIFFNLCRDVCR